MLVFEKLSETCEELSIERTEVCAEGHLRQRGRVNTLRHHALKASRIVSYSDTRKQKTLSIFYSYRIGRPMSCLDVMTCFENRSQIYPTGNSCRRTTRTTTISTAAAAATTTSSIAATTTQTWACKWTVQHVYMSVDIYHDVENQSKILYSRLYRLAH